MPGLGKKTFTAGDVLIAGDVNNYLMDQTVMNFAGTAARNAAIPVPSTGMTTYIGTTGTATIPQIETYTGSAWQTPYGLTQVANVAWTTGGTIDIQNVFTSAYQFYQINIYVKTTLATPLVIQLLNGATVLNSALYYRAGWIGSPLVGTLAAWNQSGTTSNEIMGEMAPGGSSVITLNYVSNQAGQIATWQVQSSQFAAAIGSGSGSGYHQAAVNFNGFRLASANGGNFAGEVRVYGLRKS